MIASDENEKQIPNLNLAHKIFLAENKIKKNENTDELKKTIIEDIILDSMASLYTELCEKFGWERDEDELNKMIAANKLSMENLDLKIVEATENAGDTEVIDLQ